MTTIAVTGTSGHLGRLTIEALIDRGADPASLVAIARTTAKAKDLADRGVAVRHGDYTDPASLDAALEGVDRLVLVSSSEVGQRAPQHRNVIAAAERAGVSRLIYTSILKADHTTNPLAPEHVETERALAESPIPSTILRNSWYLENYTAQIPQYTATGAITSATKNAKLSAATRRDYAEAAAVAATQDAEGDTYELAGQTFTMSYLADIISAVTNAYVHHNEVTATELAAGMASGAGMDEDTARFWASIDTAIAKGDLQSDSTALADLIGHEPTTVEEAVRAAV